MNAIWQGLITSDISLEGIMSQHLNIASLDNWSSILNTMACYLNWRFNLLPREINTDCIGFSTVGIQIVYAAHWNSQNKLIMLCCEYSVSLHINLSEQERRPLNPLCIWAGLKRLTLSTVLTSLGSNPHVAPTIGSCDVITIEIRNQRIERP